jgi:hypothetical protein
MISSIYANLCREASDINEHLPTLYAYAMRCSHITECGVRDIVSSYAFANALKNSPANKLIQVDPYRSPSIDAFAAECKSERINAVFYNQSDLECPMEPTELLFIDTWHVYGHLKRELDRWNGSVSKYIILHDTTSDEFLGETIRMRYDAIQQSKDTGIPLEEIQQGIWPAVEEFLEDHPEWVLRERFTHNNGLTILERKPRIAFITAIYGGYEASCKSFAQQTIPTDFICFTDNPDIAPNGWTIDTTPYHETHRAPEDTGDHLNSLENTRHTFILAKYYKQAFQNIPRLKDYDVVVWVDGTIKIHNPLTSERMLRDSLQNKSVIWEHSWRSGSLKSEIVKSR